MQLNQGVETSVLDGYHYLKGRDTHRKEGQNGMTSSNIPGEYMSATVWMSAASLIISVFRHLMKTS